MGKYMKKSKITNDVAVMEVGVRTRAKTLALQEKDPSSYLELRSRRLEKPPQLPKPSNNPKRSLKKSEEGCFGNLRKNEEEVVQVSEFGESNELLDMGFEGRDRESTPCSFVRDSDTIRMPGSTTRPTNTAAIQRALPREITQEEMEEFFAFEEQKQQRLFLEKYNFDIVSDMPLPGRYGWVPITP